jgi:hypothetical protein
MRANRFVPVVLVFAACGPSGDDGPDECATALLAGDVVITEVFADYDAVEGSGTDDGKEWFEIYNNAGAPLDLGGLTITHSRPDGSMAKTHVLAATTIPADGYLVLGNVLPALVPGHVDYGYADELGDLYNSDGGTLTLSCGDAEIDSAEYDMVEAGASRQFDGGGLPDYTANDDLTNWCAATPEAADEFEPGNFGTPGSPNEDCQIVIAGQCDDAGTPRDAVPPIPGDLVLTEVMPSPSEVGDEDGEWFEVLVTRDVDLNGVTLDRAGDSGGGDLIESADCVRVTAGSYVVFARNPDTAANGGLPAVTATFGFSMVAGSVASPGDVQLLYDGETLDSFTWTDSETGASLQVDPDSATIDGNDLESSWCPGATLYNTMDLGTPGAVNEACPVILQPGECFDEITGDPRAIVSPANGDVAINEWMPNPALASDASGEWMEIVALAAFDLNAIQLGDAALSTGAVITTNVCVPVGAGDFIVFAQSVDSTVNGGITGVAGAFPSGVDLVNTNGTAQIGVGGVALDTVTYASSASGRSIQLDGDGTQCNAPDGTTSYNGGTDLGTPGAAHTVECP